jgi:hypothetical protein
VNGTPGKYVRYLGYGEELYDLVADPGRVVSPDPMK